MRELETLHFFEHKGKAYRFVRDPLYTPERSCGGQYGHECEEKHREDCENWYREECQNLYEGKWIAVGCIVTEDCDGPHCRACSGVVEVDSLWGIVLEDRAEEFENYVKQGGI